MQLCDDRSNAIFDPSGHYRYWLCRRLNPGDATVLFVMLNPSTADANVDDPTIRRCMSFARSWGYSRLEVANLFALQATDPRDLLAHPDPIGPECDRHLLDAAREANFVIAAWGNHGSLHGRDERVLAALSAVCSIYALGTTKVHAPRHPLYVPGDTTPFPYARPTTSDDV